MSNSVRPQRRQPTRLPRPWDFPGKNTGVGCHFLLQCMKVKSESEIAQSCLTPSDPMDCSLPGSSIHGICQARVLKWGAIAFSCATWEALKYTYIPFFLNLLCLLLQPTPLGYHIVLFVYHYPKWPCSLICLFPLSLLGMEAPLTLTFPNTLSGTYMEFIKHIEWVKKRFHFKARFYFLKKS